MLSRPAPTKPSPLHRATVSCLVAGWLAFQVAVPVLQKFEPGSGEYRYQRYAWSMYGRLPLAHEVVLARVTEDGRLGAIPDIERFSPKLESPKPMRFGGSRLTKAELRERYRRLIEQIAAAGSDGTYVARLRWGSQRPDESAGAPWDWEHVVVRETPS